MKRAALYGRYSTDKQSEASVADQYRVCERIAKREGFAVVARFEDRGISGGTSKRPGYQAMLDAARRGEFDVIVAEDSSRLWRELAEQWRALKELGNLGIHVLGNSIDTRRDDSRILLSVQGAAAEAYRDEIARRTRRGLEGKARNRSPTGGRAYGYIAAKDSETGQVDVHLEQAAVVRRIFGMFADGASPRAIANRLNAERIPSPGASWNRKGGGPHAKRRGQWVSSALHGDQKRGTGILNNARYTGLVSWGRMRWERDGADSSVRTARPAREPLVEYQDERLRIVSDGLWRKVKARQQTVSRASAKIRNSLKRAGGKPARYLLSGLLRCQDCGSNFVRVDARRYGCSTHKNGGASACANSKKIRASDAERMLLERIEAELLTPEALDVAIVAFRDEIRRLRQTARKAHRTPAATQQAVIAKDAEIAKLKELVRTREVSSATLKPAIDAAEQERSRLLAQEQCHDHKAATVARLVPSAAEHYREAVRNLRDAHNVLPPADFAEARGLVFDLIRAPVTVRTMADGRAALSITLDPAPLFRATGSGVDNVVAGAGFEPATFGL